MSITQASSVKPIVNRGAMRLAQGDVREAEELFREAIRLEPANATAHANLGYVLACQDRHMEAIVEAEEAITLDPERDAAWAHMGMSLVALGKTEEGMAALSRAVRLEPMNTFAWDAMGRTLMGLGRPREAATAWASALSASPDEPELLISLATAFAAQDRSAEAANLLRRAVALAPEMPRAWVQLGVISLVRRDLGTAREALTTALELEPSSEDARYHAAMLEAMATPVQLADSSPDKYTVAPPEIDCDRRLPICKAACCRLRFPLSAQDVEEGVVRWTIEKPYMNRQDERGYCVHCDATTHNCQVYQQRPSVCRSYDCRNDKRIWIDFENRVINQDCLPQPGEEAETAED